LPPIADTILQGQYDLRLVALSCVIAVFASFASLNLAGRIRSSVGAVRLVWLGSAALALGGGIWSMHFVAMLAFSMPVNISYDFWSARAMR
jgi:NO-binding membrane sensor protein with MHYT domain